VNDDHHIKSELELLSKHISSDLAAIALIDQDNRIRWRYMYGNMNDRYRHMVMKPGFGLAGQVFRFGRTVIVDPMHVYTEKIRDQLPIMLSEQLLVAFAVPLNLDQRIIGVLLVGDRQEKSYNIEEVRHVEQISKQIMSALPTEYSHTLSNGILD